MALRSLGRLLPRAAAAATRANPPPRAAWAVSTRWAPPATAAVPRGSALLHASAAPRGLADALDDELKYESENYAPPEGVASPPAGWSLTEKPGNTLVQLVREDAGGETVTVDVLVDDQPDDEDEYEEDEDDEPQDTAGVVFSAAVAKRGQRLVFECRSDGSYLQILSATLEPDGEEPGDSDYIGPVFDELDERLQAEFEAYLEARGVTPQLGGYLGKVVGDKEQREYVAWLKRVREFVGQ